jgi:hypothetical protein
MRIYLAARYARYPEMQERRQELSAIGYTVVSRWIDGGHSEGTDADKERYAIEDIDDILASDVLITFTEGRSGRPSIGRHIEVGLALAYQKRLILVGYRECVFHYLPQVEHYETWHHALVALRQEFVRGE